MRLHRRWEFAGAFHAESQTGSCLSGRGRPRAGQRAVRASSGLLGRQLCCGRRVSLSGPAEPRGAATSAGGFFSVATVPCAPALLAEASLVAKAGVAVGGLWEVIGRGGGYREEGGFVWWGRRPSRGPQDE